MRKSLIWLNLLAAFSLLLFSFIWFGAYYYQLRTARLVEPWIGQAWAGDSVALREAEAFAARSGRMNPLDTRTLLLQAEMDMSKARAQRLYRAEAEKNWSAALDKIRRALRESPASAILWARLAMAKFEARQLDAEFDAAVGHALVRGRWDPEVQFYAFYAGMHGWKALTPPQQNLLAETVPLALRKARRDMHNHIMRTAIAAQWQEELAARLVDEPQLRNQLNTKTHGSRRP